MVLWLNQYDTKALYREIRLIVEVLLSYSRVVKGEASWQRW